jgi:hypothetical protein
LAATTTTNNEGVTGMSFRIDASLSYIAVSHIKGNLAAAYIGGGLPGLASYLANIFDNNEDFTEFLPMAQEIVKTGLTPNTSNIDIFSSDVLNQMLNSTAYSQFPKIRSLIKAIPIDLLSTEFISSAKNAEDTGWIIESVIQDALIDSVLSPGDVIRFALVGHHLI